MEGWSRLLRRRRAQESVRPTWPPRSGRARILIEDSDAAHQWAVERLLAHEGFDVAVCGGPERLPKGRCSLLTDGSCPLVDGADVIFNSLSLTHERNRALLDALQASAPATPLIVEATRLRARHHEGRLAGCRVLIEPASARRVLAEVEGAVGAHGATGAVTP